jgi:hypothetical protein
LVEVEGLTNFLSGLALNYNLDLCLLSN